eukprot:TRINITY_DN31176_c0_g1_i1.p1 TRINITY_DN31176_c0_g1~~TRINITY_DN31176_c0_g1_i1.p1  ORF type:complete len:803 (+),score=123.53 TRINITY_DN31176_c0_g1_i1:80-2410(+)
MSSQAADDPAASVLTEQEELLAASAFLKRLEQRTGEAMLDMEPLNWWTRFRKWFQYRYSQLPLSRWLMKVSPMSRAIHVIGIRYGASVLGYYNLAEWVVVQNFVLWLFWFVFMILPWFEHYADQSWEIRERVAGSPVEVSSDVIDAQDLLQNLFGYIDADRKTDATWFFYSGYLKEFGTYPVGVVYSLLVMGTFLVSLFTIVVAIGTSIADVNAETTVSRYQLPTVTYSWDWGVQAPAATEEFLLATWMQIQAEFHEAMSQRKFRTGQLVKAQWSEVSHWDPAVVEKVIIGGGIIVTFKGGKHSGETKELPALDPPRDRVRHTTVCCGLTKQQLKSIGGHILSFILCAASLVAMYFCVTERDTLNGTFPWVSAIIIAVVNGAIPYAQRKIVKLEGIESTKKAVVQEVIRVFFIKMANAVLLYMSIKDLEQSSETAVECPEFLIGAMFQQLLVVDMVVGVVSTVAGGMFMFKRFGRQQFNVSTEIINTLYRQCITWIGMVYSPMVLLMGAFANYVLFFVKKHVMFKTCGTPEKPINDDSAETLFKMLLLVSLVVAAVPGVSFLHTTKHCGPHYVAGCGLNGGAACETPLEALAAHIHNEWGMGKGTEWVFQPVILFAAALTFMVAAYFLGAALLSTFRRMDRQRREFTDEAKGLRELLSSAGPPEDATGQEDQGKQLRAMRLARRRSQTDARRRTDTQSFTVRHPTAGTDLDGMFRRAGVAVKAADGAQPSVCVDDLRPYIDLSALEDAIQKFKGCASPQSVPTAPDLPGTVAEGES